MKGDIHSYVLSKKNILYDIREPRFRQNNTGYQIIKIVKFNLCIILPLSQLTDITQRAPCTQNVKIVKSWDIFQMKWYINSSVLDTSSFLCDIGEPRFRQNYIGYQTFKIVKYRSIPYS